LGCCKKKPVKTSDVLIHYLKRNSKQNKSYAHKNEIPDSKKAILEYQVIKNLDHYSLLAIDLKTGRHHQIRTQLSKIGSPIKGDLKYGFDRSNSNGGIHLHSRRLSFMHPVKSEKIILTAPLPKDPIWNACG
jgi:23S rRNA pseudouridine1911/1915/1917 synthase